MVQKLPEPLTIGGRLPGQKAPGLRLELGLLSAVCSQSPDAGLVLDLWLLTPLWNSSKCHLPLRCPHSCLRCGRGHRTRPGWPLPVLETQPGIRRAKPLATLHGRCPPRTSCIIYSWHVLRHDRALIPVPWVGMRALN